MLTTEYIEDFAAFNKQASDYFEDHYKGCEEYRAEIKGMSINVDLIQKMIDKGVVNFFALREDDKLVGYVNVSINMSFLFPEPQAVIDFLYIVPELRRNNYASKAIEEIEKELKKEGLMDISLLLPDKDYSESVAKSLDYVKTSTIYTKCLGDK